MFRARNSKNKTKCLSLFAQDGNEFIVFDTETTGLDPSCDRIVELAAQKYRVADHKPVLIDSLHLYMKPPFCMNEKVVSVHHISNEFLADKPDEHTVFPKIYEFFGMMPAVCGHNVRFDTDMLSAMYARENQILLFSGFYDTLEMARDNLESTEIKDYLVKTGMSKKEANQARLYELGVLTKLYALDEGLTFHSASDDVIATERLLETMYLIYKESPPAHYRERIGVRGFHYWKGKNKQQAGLWISSYQGNLYYSTYYKEWRSSTVDLSKYDIDVMEDYVLKRLGMTIQEVGRLTEKKWNTWLEQKRAVS